ncbi:MAG TPA: LytTR family DNA-binding domain-containing protein [Bacteroidia bacterium]
MSNLSVILVDDEEQARFSLRKFLGDYCPEVNIIAEEANVADAIKAINRHKPDVVFLDIEMPGLSGLQILDFFNEEEITFQIIFVTAYSEYAIHAFKMAATDYLLKPLNIDQLVAAVEKAKLKKGQKELSESVRVLKANSNEQSEKKIALSITGGLLYVRTSEIIFAEADGSYCKFYFTNRAPELVSKKLKEYEELLIQLPGFFRPHRSYIINTKNIKQFVRADGGYLVMENDMQIPLARGKKEELLQLIS